MKRTFFLLASTVVMAGLTANAQAADDILAQAKSYTTDVTKSHQPWTGPTTGPAAQHGKTIVFVSADQRDSGPRGVAEAVKQAAHTIGWNYRLIDGQGSISGRSAALNQAIALKPDGIVLGSVDEKEQAALIQQATSNGIKIVGWHSLSKPGPAPQYGIFTNLATDPLDVAKAAVMYVIAKSDGKAGVVIFTDSTYEIATAKSDAMAALAEPVSQQGWQAVDELNRAFSGVPASGFTAPVHLVTEANVASDGGKQNQYDPDNNYRDVYRHIWNTK
jgi:ribose transport system substrate-binding protein